MSVHGFVIRFPHERHGISSTFGLCVVASTLPCPLSRQCWSHLSLNSYMLDAYMCSAVSLGDLCTPVFCPTHKCFFVLQSSVDSFVCDRNDLCQCCTFAFDALTPCHHRLHMTCSHVQRICLLMPQSSCLFMLEDTRNECEWMCELKTKHMCGEWRKSTRTWKELCTVTFFIAPCDMLHGSCLTIRRRIRNLSFCIWPPFCDLLLRRVSIACPRMSGRTV